MTPSKSEDATPRRENLVPPAEVGELAPADPNDVVLEGPRLSLRRARDEDRDALAAILSEPEVVRWWGPFDPQTAFDEIDASFAIVIDGAVAGWLPYTEEDWWQYPSVAFDIALSTAVQGRGYGREALRVAIAHFVARGHHRFTIDPSADNERAIRCYAGVGFREVGVLRAYERRDGAWHDGLLMDLLADELVEG
ncbi:MAG TPA: GNAT family protein [Solirubrobacteraceae bacterium]|nr:GNAT family protein [Solirubrobacteraceae bacterium]